MDTTARITSQGHEDKRDMRFKAQLTALAAAHRNTGVTVQ